MEEQDFDKSFSGDLIATGFGSLWCADYRWPLLVRVDKSLRGEVFLELPLEVSQNDEAPRFRGPSALAIGLGAIWLVPRRRSLVLRVDPETASIQSFELPFETSEIAVGRDAVFFIGGWGDGRVARLEPAKGVETATVGRSLRLLATDADLVWTVDDPVADVIALDSTTLSVRSSFHHLGGPDALVAHGRSAWYLASPEVELPRENGRQQRAGMLFSTGPVTNFLRFDVADGTTEPLDPLPSIGAQAAIGSDGIWVTADSVAEMETSANPESRLIHVDFDGTLVSSESHVGQLHSVAVDEDFVWTSGFRRSLQAGVLSARRHDMTLLGETTLPELDLSPWYPPEPEAQPLPPMPERAENLRAWLDRALREPSQVHGRFGDTWEEPAISEEFRLERVEVRTNETRTEIAILFWWEGEADLFGMSFPLNETDATADDYIGVYLEENLLAGGFGVENARREQSDGVTWLSWAQWDTDE